MAPTGDLRDDEGTTLIFNVKSASQPDDPRSDWQGFSGSAIVHREVRNPKDLWVYGVAQQVPANFTKKIEVARLAEALSDPKLREVLIGPKLDKLAPADPCLLPAAKDFPDIARLREFTETRLNTASLKLLDTRATLCLSFAELEKLHRGGASSAETFAPAELLAKFRSGGALLVKAPGGFGKSFFLLRTMLEAIDQGMVPFFLDLRSAELKLDGAPDEDACAELFKKPSQRAVKWDILRKARDKDLGIFIAVDGLNEALTPDAIERTLAYLLKNFSDRLVLMVSDRMSERPPPFAAQLCTILRLSPAVVAGRFPELNLDSLRGDFKYLLSIPFFLALYEEIARSVHAADARPLFRTRSEMLFAYIALCYDSRIGYGDMQETGRKIVAKLAPVAFEGYRPGGVRMNGKWLLAELKKIELAPEKLLTSGLLVKEPQDTLAFSHQLFHDFLAGYHLATKNDPQSDGPAEAYWSSANFDIATLKAISFDALYFAVELVPDRADAFVTEVYDWNYQAAIHLILNLATNDTTPEADRARALRDALIAVNCEKRFDPFQHTRNAAAKRAASIAQIYQSPFNDATLASFGALREIVRTEYQYSGDYYQTWKRMFLLTEKPQPRDWALLQASPLIAWTAANAFRRSLNEGDPLIDYLCGLYDAIYARQRLADAAIGARWRIVHILGAADGDNGVEKLFDAVVLEARAPQTQWVQYGAVRSLVEIAARRAEAKLADAILEKLIAVMGPTISVDSRTFGELREVAIPACPPPWWTASYSAVLKKGAELALTPEDRNLWTERLATLMQSSPSVS